MKDAVHSIAFFFFLFFFLLNFSSPILGQSSDSLKPYEGHSLSMGSVSRTPSLAVLVFGRPNVTFSAPRIASCGKHLLIAAVAHIPVKGDTVGVIHSEDGGITWSEDQLLSENEENMDLFSSVEGLLVSASSQGYLVSFLGESTGKLVLVKYYSGNFYNWSKTELTFNLPTAQDYYHISTTTPTNSTISTIIYPTTNPLQLQTFSLANSITGPTTTLYKPPCPFNWLFSNGLANPNNTLFFLAIAYRSSSDPTCSFNTQTLLFYSNDDGSSWISILLSSTPNDGTAPLINFVPVLSQAPNNVISTFPSVNGSIFVSFDNFISWQALNSPPGPNSIQKSLYWSYYYSSSQLIIYWITNCSSSSSPTYFLNFLSSDDLGKNWKSHPPVTLPLSLTPSLLSQLSLGFIPTASGYFTVWGYEENPEGEETGGEVYYMYISDSQVVHWQRASLWVWVFVVLFCFVMMIGWCVSVLIQRGRVEERVDLVT